MARLDDTIYIIRIGFRFHQAFSPLLHSACSSISKTHSVSEDSPLCGVVVVVVVVVLDQKVKRKEEAVRSGNDRGTPERTNDTLSRSNRRLRKSQIILSRYIEYQISM